MNDVISTKEAQTSANKRDTLVTYLKDKADREEAEF